MKKILSAALLVTLSACATPPGQSQYSAAHVGQAVQSEPTIVLERNYAEILVRDAPRCPRTTLYREADGSLWIGTPKRADAAAVKKSLTTQERENAQ